MSKTRETGGVKPSPDIQQDIEVRRAASGQGVPLHRVHRGIAVFYVLALLLNAEAIHRGAGRMPYGPGRDLALRISTPIADAARGLRIHLPRRWIEKAVHGPDA